MTPPTITIQLPVTLYDQLQQIAQQTQTDLVQVIQRLLSQHALERYELAGAYSSEQPLMNDVSKSVVSHNWKDQLWQDVESVRTEIDQNGGLSENEIEDAIREYRKMVVASDV